MNILAEALGARGVGACALIVHKRIWRPMRDFFDLREGVRGQLLRFEGLKWRVSSIFDDARGEGIVDQAAFGEAQTIFGDQSDQLIAFARSNWIAAFFIRCWGVDPDSAGRHLAVLADELGALNEDRDVNYDRVARALKF